MQPIKKSRKKVLKSRTVRKIIMKRKKTISRKPRNLIRKKYSKMNMINKEKIGQFLNNIRKKSKDFINKHRKKQNSVKRNNIEENKLLLDALKKMYPLHQINEETAHKFIYRN